MAWRRRDAVVALGLLVSSWTGHAFILRPPGSLSSLPASRPLSARLTRLQSTSEDDPQVLVKAATLLPPWTEAPAPPASSGQSSWWEKVWRNCDESIARLCQGNALDDPTYRAGVVASIGITLALSSQHPALHSLYTSIEHSPPVPLLNAAAAVAAAVGMAIGGNSLEALSPKPSNAPVLPPTPSSPERVRKATMAGLELGVWITIASALNVAGLASTSASHAAFLIQLTTLMVPIAQGVMGVPIPRQIWAGVLLALAGLYLFTNDPASAAQTSLDGDLLCVLSAVFYSAYDVRFFDWGKELADKPVEMIQYKVVAQALLSVLLVVGLWTSDAAQGKADEIAAFVHSVTAPELLLITPVVLWCGLVVNAAVSVAQVGAVQALGASRSQIIYATGPFWSALMSMAVLGEKAGPSSLAGGTLFMLAMLVGATAPPPESVCDDDTGKCEV